MLCHIQPATAEGNEAERPAQEEAEAGAETPGEDGGTCLDPGGHVMLTVHAGQINRTITELGGDD